MDANVIGNNSAKNETVLVANKNSHYDRVEKHHKLHQPAKGCVFADETWHPHAALCVGEQMQCRYLPHKNNLTIFWPAAVLVGNTVLKLEKTTTKPLPLEPDAKELHRFTENMATAKRHHDTATALDAACDFLNQLSKYYCSQHLINAQARRACQLLAETATDPETKIVLLLTAACVPNASHVARAALT